jgi:hypothetical protein
MIIFINNVKLFIHAKFMCWKWNVDTYEKEWQKA